MINLSPLWILLVASTAGAISPISLYRRIWSSTAKDPRFIAIARIWVTAMTAVLVGLVAGAMVFVVTMGTFNNALLSIFAGAAAALYSSRMMAQLFE